MSNNNVEISKMTLDDFESIKNVLIAEFDDFWNATTFEAELANENSYYLVAKLDGNIVGFAGIKIVLDEADIMNIVTKKDLRNYGIGSALFSEILKYSKDAGVCKITLEVNENNTSAIHLYEKFGFKEIAVREKYYNNAYNAIIMQLSLK